MLQIKPQLGDTVLTREMQYISEKCDAFGFEITSLKQEKLFSPTPLTHAEASIPMFVLISQIIFTFIFLHWILVMKVIVFK